MLIGHSVIAGRAQGAGLLGLARHACPCMARGVGPAAAVIPLTWRVPEMYLACTQEASPVSGHHLSAARWCRIRRSFLEITRQGCRACARSFFRARSPSDAGVPRSHEPPQALTVHTSQGPLPPAREDPHFRSCAIGRRLLSNLKHDLAARVPARD